ncbi:rhomboid family intramembrane serine protease GlpG [Ferrimonas balearica]|uniref:rhomboid family intramembrane serine protease GlpG n=1 Tax=Ferrimonas balearica TaxID=44012 RepID=UPI001C991711|nr:rhomboid family intramembrane serine protease GlpG [Ferrimonas balearica]MBY5994068.1 rhomboid family intramembrane serine protease GlpG [Ferrimonas balearica]
MMEIGVLGDPRAAQALVDYMKSKGITARFERAEDGVAVLVEAEHYHRGREEFERFVANPYHKRYMAASWQSGDAQARFQYGGGGSLWRSFLAGAGPLTLSVLAVVAGIWVFWILGFNQLIFNWTHFFPTWEAMGQGQWWRIFTPSLIHFSAMHVIFNLLWWWYLGGRIERFQGSGTLLILLLVAGTLPNLAQFAFVGPNFGGLSGVVYALVGYCWIRGRLDPASPLALPPAYVGFLLLWLVMGFMGFMNMANAAHLGGLLVGMGQAALDSRRR